MRQVEEHRRLAAPGLACDEQLRVIVQVERCIDLLAVVVVRFGDIGRSRPAVRVLSRLIDRVKDSREISEFRSCIGHGTASRSRATIPPRHQGGKSGARCGVAASRSED
jgi:Ribonuclease G/E